MGRKISFAEGEFYHVYNRGVDKRIIFEEPVDYLKFLDGLYFFNQEENIESLYKHNFTERNRERSDPLVEIHAYSLLPNHFHLVLQPLQDDGVSIFMHRLGTSYTNYFNHKYERSGSLFQGTFKARHVEHESSLRYVLAYVHLNPLVHNLRSLASETYTSMHEAATGLSLNKEIICVPHVAVQEHTTVAKYKRYAADLLEECIEQRIIQKETRRKTGLAQDIIE